MEQVHRRSKKANTKKIDTSYFDNMTDYERYAHWWYAITAYYKVPVNDAGQYEVMSVAGDYARDSLVSDMSLEDLGTAWNKWKRSKNGNRAPNAIDFIHLLGKTYGSRIGR